MLTTCKLELYVYIYSSANKDTLVFGTSYFLATVMFRSTVNPAALLQLTLESVGTPSTKNAIHRARREDISQQRFGCMSLSVLECG